MAGNVKWSYLGLQVDGMLRGDGGQILEAKHAQGFLGVSCLTLNASSLVCQSGIPGSSLAKRE